MAARLLFVALLAVSAGCASLRLEPGKRPSPKDGLVASEHCRIGFLTLMETAARMDEGCRELFSVPLTQPGDCPLEFIRLAHECHVYPARMKGRATMDECASTTVKRYRACFVPRGGRARRQPCVDRAVEKLLLDLPDECRESEGKPRSEDGGPTWTPWMCESYDVQDLERIYGGAEMASDDASELQRRSDRMFQVFEERIDERRECLEPLELMFIRSAGRGEGADD